MRHIVKGREPRSLTEHRAAAHADYDNYEDKLGLRSALLQDQGWLCCYCMSRIDPEGMKIEHWAAQTTHPGLQLDYRNLLGACHGGEGLPRSRQHCDTHKGDQAITIHPADPQRSCERGIVYLEDGTIDGREPEVRHGLQHVLNLNLYWLRENRSAAMLGAKAAMNRKYPGAWRREQLEREVQRWRDRDSSGRYKEYCQAVVFWLEKRLARESPP